MHIKYYLNDEEQEKRQKRAKQFLNRSRRDPNWLKDVYFVDECAITFDHEIRKGVRIYCDAHDKGYKYVIPCKKVDPNKKIKVHIFAAVNYREGACFLEFSTGTTDIQRRFNKEPGQQREKRYKVGATG